MDGTFRISISEEELKNGIEEDGADGYEDEVQDSDSLLVSFFHFYTQQHICYSAYMPSQFRLSVHLSHGWISQKRLKLGLCSFHHTVAPSL